MFNDLHNILVENSFLYEKQFSINVSLKFLNQITATHLIKEDILKVFLVHTMDRWYDGSIELVGAMLLRSSRTNESSYTF